MKVYKKSKNSYQNKMFCADYIAAFIFHGGVNFHLWKIQDETLRDQWYFPFAHGAFSGLLGAICVYPMDFVRHEVIQSKNIIHNMSTVPYATVFFGLYFSQRDKASLSSQVLWATASAGLAVLAEFPFDKAKKTMMGSSRTLILANSLYVPFGAMILVMYDKAVIKLNSKSVEA